MEGVSGRLPAAVVKRRHGNKMLVTRWRGWSFLITCPGGSYFKKTVQNKTGEKKMKKFWIAILVVGLFMAFTMPAIAAVGGVDVQFSGTYRVRGWIDDAIGAPTTFAKNNVNKGQAFYDNRLRMETTFKVAEGLKLVTRFDALEKKWGQSVAAYGSSYAPNNNDSISFERAYVSFTTGLGTFNVGYQDWQRFGTQFMDSDLTYPGIKWINTFGPLTVLAGTEKRTESITRNTSTYVVTGNQNYNSGYVDVDMDVYDLGFIFKFKGGDAGLLYQYYRVNDYSQAATQDAVPFKRSIHLFDGYGKFKFGPVYVEGEAFYTTGTWIDYTNNDRNNYQNTALEAWGMYLNAEVEFKPIYAGGKFVYVSGDDGTSGQANNANTRHGSIANAVSLGQDHDFALMIGNYEYFNQVTANGVAGGAGWTNGSQTLTYSMENIWAWQLYVGVKPTPKIDVRLAVTDAYVQTLTSVPLTNNSTPIISNHIGTEVDLRASYKIFDNLTYSAGFGYMFAGDFFKGTNSANSVSNDYLLMHQLMLSF
jgi:hypothetical protein